MKTTGYQQITIERPTGTLDAKRFDARLTAAGVPSSAIADGAISQEAADAFVPGGFTALSDAARTSGNRDVLDATDPDALGAKNTPMQSLMTAIGLGPDKKATKTVEKAAFSLQHAALRLKQESLASNYDTTIDFFSSVNSAARNLDGALAPETLGRASPGSVDNLRAGLKAFYEGYSKLTSVKGPEHVWASDFETIQAALANIPATMNRAADLLDLGVSFKATRTHD